MSVETKDHFSGHADRYLAFRPDYPDSLFVYLSSLCASHQLAWDCATGNGQAAAGLAPFFQSIVATDFSQKQIDHARPRDNIRYSVAGAERAPLADSSVDLVTVAQALHWFDRDRFYDEVRRVARPEGVIAIWCYELHAITPLVDAVVHHYYADIVGSDWPAERVLVEDGYRTIDFPFDELVTPPFRMVHHWTLYQVLGYLGSWSATQRCQKRTGSNPLDLIAHELQAAWGDPQNARAVTWPLNLRVGRVVSSVPESGNINAEV